VWRNSIKGFFCSRRQRVINPVTHSIHRLTYFKTSGSRFRMRIQIPEPINVSYPKCCMRWCRYFKDLSYKGDGLNQLKISGPLPLRETHFLTPLSAKSVSLFSPFKPLSSQGTPLIMLLFEWVDHDLK
jgi:hypothetical protein